MDDNGPHHSVNTLTVRVPHLTVGRHTAKYPYLVFAGRKPTLNLPFGSGHENSRLVLDDRSLSSRWFWRPAQSPVHLGVRPLLVLIELLPLLVA